MSYRRIEEVADGLRPLLPLSRGASPWKVDAEAVLERTLPRMGFNFHVVDKATLEDCAGLTIPGRNLVVLRQDVYDGLSTGDVFARSTVIHELSHIVLNHAVTLRRGTAAKHRFCEDSEWQAKALTAAIMMPMAACTAAECDPTELANLCGTSIQAATYRISNLQKYELLSEAA